jgi:uncharacterized protein involved in high-affinity Fe2+ transport/mono/diheme cytochrome c family protein
MNQTTRLLAAALGVSAALALSVAGLAHENHDEAAPKEPIRITAEELHKHGGVPPGWKFTVPPGDAGKGGEVFAKLECHKCHEVKGKRFPHVGRQPGDTGPELTGVGSHHPAEYLAQSVLDPNAVIVTAPGHTGPDGRSIMPDFTDVLTARELIDLVAFLKSLTEGDGHAHGHAAAPARERSAGDYRIRLDYHAARDDHGQGAGAAKPHGHLMVFITDVRTGEPVPYLPVTATIHAEGSPALSVQLQPMAGGRGFHYGADLDLPPRTSRITVAVGATTMRLMPSAAGRYSKPQQAAFDWKETPAHAGEGRHGERKGH